MSSSQLEEDLNLGLNADLPGGIVAIETAGEKQQYWNAVVGTCRGCGFIWIHVSWRSCCSREISQITTTHEYTRERAHTNVPSLGKRVSPRHAQQPPAGPHCLDR